LLIPSPIDCAREGILHEILKHLLNIGVAITGVLIARLLSIIAYLLVDSVDLT
jgi:hypothetical protein